jgi:SAM-dependent methyltransferase
MNEAHAQLCTSPEWAAYLCDEVLLPFAGLVSLGTDMLEIGPGPGAATDWLRSQVTSLTVVEVDPAACDRLATRFAGTNVRVVPGDATELPFPDESFDSVGSFTMLHHVPTHELQHRILAEAHRVLRPGGVLVGSDSLASVGLHDFHAGDTYNPIEPATLLARLPTFGFDRVNVDVGDVLRFIAYKPQREMEPCRDTAL